MFIGPIGFLTIGINNTQLYLAPKPLRTPTFTPTSVPTRSLPKDMVWVPDEILQLELQIANSLESQPSWNRTSDFMLGTVTIAIILPDCTGLIDTCSENWDATEVTHLMDELQTALTWWEQKALENGAVVTFTIASNHPLTIPTGYEPIQRPGGGVVLCGQEGLWIDEVMAHLGYNSYFGDNTYLLEIRGYNNDLRELYNTDWAFTIFVADSSNNPTGMFGPTTCGGTVAEFSVPAWAYVAGPHLGMNTINNGYGNIFIDGVAAHEIGHIFGAPDEYPSGSCMQPPSVPSCTDAFGYLGFPNQNCGSFDNTWSCLIDIDLSIMRPPQDYGSGTNYSVVHGYLIGHVGWHDSDNDGLSDPIDTTPLIVLTPASPDPTMNLVSTYTGLTEDLPFPSALPNPTPWRPEYPSETINKIISVEFKIDNGNWIKATASDGLFDQATESYYFNALLCTNGIHNVQVRAINSVHHVSNIQSDTITVNSPSECYYIYLPVISNTSDSVLLLISPTPPSGYPINTPTPSGYP